MPKLLHWLKEFRSKLQLLKHKPFCSQYSDCAKTLMEYSVIYILTCKGTQFCSVVACLLYLHRGFKVQSFPSKSFGKCWLDYWPASAAERGRNARWKSR